jgi:nicotinamide riboside kinase
LSLQNEINSLHLLKRSNFKQKESLIEAPFLFIDKMYKEQCIVVNLIGGPGVGKSILTSEVFAELKRKFVSAEISPEYIKKKLREGSIKAVQSQIYIFGKQQYQLFTMKDEVDVIVTDSPFIFSSIYDSTRCPELRKLILKEFNKYDNMNYYIRRDTTVPYEQEGRYQDSEGAKEVDETILAFLKNNNLEYKPVEGIGKDVRNMIVEEIIEKLNGKK